MVKPRMSSRFTPPSSAKNDEPHAGLEPLSLWLIAIYGLAIFFGGAYLGRYSGNFSGDGLDPFGGAPRSTKSGRPVRDGADSAELSRRAR